MKFVGLLVLCGMCVIAIDLKNSVFFQKRKTFNIVRSTWFVSIILDLKPYVGFVNEVGNNCAYTQRLIASTQMKFRNTVQNSSFIKQFEFLGKEVRELELGQENLNILLREYQILMTKYSPVCRKVKHIFIWYGKRRSTTGIKSSHQSVGTAAIQFSSRCPRTNNGYESLKGANIGKQVGYKPN